MPLTMRGLPFSIDVLMKTPSATVLRKIFCLMKSGPSSGLVRSLFFKVAEKKSLSVPPWKTIVVPSGPPASRFWNSRPLRTSAAAGALQTRRPIRRMTEDRDIGSVARGMRTNGNTQPDRRQFDDGGGLPPLRYNANMQTVFFRRAARHIADLILLVPLLVLAGPGANLAAETQRKPVPSAAPRVALVIGNAAYSRLNPLENPGKDADLIADKLRRLGFEVTLKANRDLKAMGDDVEAFGLAIKQRGPDTVSVFYYAGHGLESDGINYLVPVDADIKRKADVAGRAVSVKRIADRLASAGNRVNILILDACRDNPFPDGAATTNALLGLAPMGAVYGAFIASATGSGKAAFDGENGHSPYTLALAQAIGTPGEKLEDVFKSVRRQVRLATSEQQIPWESTSIEADFYFVPPAPPPSPAAQLLAAATETDSLALFELLVDRFPGSEEAARGRSVLAQRQRAEAKQAGASGAGEVLARARQVRTPDAFDLVASLFPDSPEAAEARASASRLRETAVLDSAGPTFEGRELISRLQEELTRLACLGGSPNGAFDAPTVGGLRRASLLTDEHYLWHRPTMAALRALKKIDSRDGCARQKVAASPRCLRINNEDFCQ
ncbi:caspase family protein [Bradyrhizobium oligotrophicum]|uniref:caspase family protein n=1 Tax=Bradyrhizobium oligotrophicum TaxID=44255 RepID=UPI003EB834F0